MPRPNMWKRFAHWLNRGFFRDDFARYEQEQQDAARHRAIEQDKEKAERIIGDLRRQERLRALTVKMEQEKLRTEVERDRLNEYVRNMGKLSPFDKRYSFCSQLTKVSEQGPESARAFLAGLKKADLDAMAANFKPGSNLCEMVNEALKQGKAQAPRSAVNRQAGRQEIRSPGIGAVLPK